MKDINDSLDTIMARADEAIEHYDNAGENREIALANYTMGEEYCEDIPKLVGALKVALKALEHFIEHDDFHDVGEKAMAEIREVMGVAIFNAHEALKEYKGE